MESTSEFEAVRQAYGELVSAADALYRAADRESQRRRVTELIDLLESAVGQAIDNAAAPVDRGIRPLR